MTKMLCFLNIKPCTSPITLTRNERNTSTCTIILEKAVSKKTTTVFNPF